MSAKHEKVEALFNEALKLKPEERNAFLAEACGNDADLRRQVDEFSTHRRTIRSTVLLKAKNRSERSKTIYTASRLSFRLVEPSAF